MPIKSNGVFYFARAQYNIKVMDILKELKAEVFAKQKILADIYNQHGSFSLFDYAGSWQVAKSSEEINLLAKEAEALLLPIYGIKIALGVSKQLMVRPLVSTIDHHGILNHPYFINSNLIFSQKKDLNYLICLTTSGISLNNSSWPGCLLLTAKAGNLKRFSFFPDKIKTHSVFKTQSLNQTQVENVLGKISRDRELKSQEKEKLQNLIFNLFSKKEIYELETFSAQASLLSARFWQELFPAAPKLIYLPVEELAAKIIIKIIAPNPDHILHKLLFTRPGLDLIEKYFAGSLGAFFVSHKGSFLFWGMDAKGGRLRLGREKYLETTSSPEALAKALQVEQLYPTSLVCFLVLLYYQLTCLGGFNQVNWLTVVKQGFVKLLQEMGQLDLAKKITAVPTQNFAESNLAFLEKNGKIIKASGTDIYLSGKDLYSKYQNLAKSLTLGEGLASLLPEIYRVITPASLRKSKLLKLTDEDIILSRGTGGEIRQALI